MLELSAGRGWEARGLPGASGQVWVQGAAGVPPGITVLSGLVVGGECVASEEVQKVVV